VSKDSTQSNPEHLANRVEVAGFSGTFVDLVWIFVFRFFFCYEQSPDVTQDGSRAELTATSRAPCKKIYDGRGDAARLSRDHSGFVYVDFGTRKMTSRCDARAMIKPSGRRDFHAPFRGEINLSRLNLHRSLRVRSFFG